MYFIDAPKTVIPALDCPLPRAVEIVRGVQSIDLVQAFKLGAWQGTLRPGLDAWIEALGPYLNGRKLIYDHQKGGTDIPELEVAMADLADAGVHAVILFPFGGGVTQERWTAAAMDAGLTVIVGGHMTQKRFLWSEGGYIHDDAPKAIYRLAVEQGVRDFVVPGNKPDFVLMYKEVIEEVLAGEPFTLYAPGFIRQGGAISETGAIAGERWHGIVGTAFTKAEDVEAVARELTSQIA